MSHAFVVTPERPPAVHGETLFAPMSSQSKDGQTAKQAREEGFSIPATQTAQQKQEVKVKSGRAVQVKSLPELSIATWKQWCKAGS